MSLSSSSNPSFRPARLRGRLLASSVLFAVAAISSGAHAQVALPEGGQVVAGAATIATGGGTMHITQTSGNAILNWQDFSIGQGGAVTFDNGSGATLNRVTGAAVSRIDGRLSATGSLYLINQNGVIVGQSGVVETGGGFVASTLDIADAAFLGGGDRRFAGPSQAQVINLGRIGALGGNVALIARAVTNAGTITAPGGSVGLIAGHNVLLRDSAVDGGRFLVVAGGGDTSVTNSGTITAAAVDLAAEGGNIYALAGNTGGIIKARGISHRDGHVYLSAGAGGTVSIGDSAISAVAGDGAGGQITITGHDIDVGAGAQLDVSAEADVGAGGRIVTIADMVGGHLNFHGVATARGGVQGGAGGFVETSGAFVDTVGTRIDTRAADGTAGLWLTDPYDLIVDTAAAATIQTNLATTNVTLQTTAGGSSGPGTPNPAGQGDIFVNADITWSSANVLTLDAYRSVAIRANLTVTGAGGVVINTNNGGTGGDYSFGANKSLKFTGPSGSLTINGAPYTLIRTMAQLDAIDNHNATTTANGAAFANTTTNIALANDLDAAGTTYVRALLGISNARKYSGNFTGLGNTISNLTINNAVVGYTGLVGYLDGGSVRDLNLSGGTISSSKQFLGALVGYANAGTISTINSSATVTGTIGSANIGGLVGFSNVGISDFGVTGAVFAAVGSYVGGVVGQTSAFVRNGYSTGNVTTSADYTGGIAGWLLDTAVMNGVTYSGDVISSANYTGGLTGNNDGAIIDSTTTGTVSGTTHVGGLAGYMGPTGSITNGLMTNTVTGSADAVGGLVGTSQGLITDSQNTGTVLGDFNVGGLVGYNDTTGRIEFSNFINSSVTAPSGFGGGIAGSNFGLIADSHSTSPVSGGTSTGGLAGSNEASGQIIRSYATGAVTSSGSGVGGLVGSNFGLIQESRASGAVDGQDEVGGLIGGMGDGSVINAFATGNVNGGARVGGLIGGLFDGTVLAAHAHGAVRGGSMVGGLIGEMFGAASATQVFSTGYVSGGLFYGGLMGFADGTVTNAYWNVETSGQTDADTTGNNVATGLTTAQLQAGLPSDFSTTYWAGGSGFFPYLKSFYTAPQAVSGFAYAKNGSAAAGDTVRIYLEGADESSNILVSSVGVGANGYYYYLLNNGGAIGTTRMGVSMVRGSGPATTGITYTDTPKLVTGQVTGLNVTEGRLDVTTRQTTITGGLADAADLFQTGYGAYVADTNSTWIQGTNSLTADQSLTRDGSIRLEARNGDLTINSGIVMTSNASGDAVVMAANGSFINQSGPGVIAAANGRWLVYSQANGNSAALPTGNVLGGLNARNMFNDPYNFTTGTFALTPNSGNRFVYGYGASLFVTPVSLIYEYDKNVRSTTYNLTGYLTPADQADDILTGSVNPLQTSSSNAGVYNLLASGTLASDLNYNIVYQTGTITITPAALILAASTDSRAYDATTGSAGAVNVTGLKGSDTVTGASQSFDSPDVGPRTLDVNSGYVINDGNGGANYSVTTQTASGAITLGPPPPPAPPPPAPPPPAPPPPAPPPPAPPPPAPPPPAPPPPAPPPPAPPPPAPPPPAPPPPAPPPPAPPPPAPPPPAPPPPAPPPPAPPPPAPPPPAPPPPAPPPPAPPPPAPPPPAPPPPAPPPPAPPPAPPPPAPPPPAPPPPAPPPPAPPPPAPPPPAPPPPSPIAGVWAPPRCTDMTLEVFTFTCGEAFGRAIEPQAPLGPIPPAFTPDVIAVRGSDRPDPTSASAPVAPHNSTER